jgi:hypothetical protein
VRRRLLAIATTVASAAVVAAAPARAATVELRVGSASDPAPLFAGPVTTLPHPVDGGDGSGPHPCTGPTGAATATATGALDDGLRGAGIPWRGNWDPSFRDFFIDSIGPYTSAPPDRYWSLTVNGRFASGGCLASVADGDLVELRYGSLFGPAPAPTPGKSPGGATGPRGQQPSATPDAGRPLRLRRVAGRAARFLRGHDGAVGAEWGRLALAVRRGHGLHSAAANLLRGRLAELASGSFGGDVNATALTAIALERRDPKAAARCARWLVSVQSPDGGFGFRPDAAPDIDSTGLAVWALARKGRLAAARRGAAFIRSAQTAAGGFPAQPGGSANAQSTGLGLLGLRAADVKPPTDSSGHGPLGFLASLAQPNGAIAYEAGLNPTPAWTSAQALLGLIARAKLLG